MATKRKTEETAAAQAEAEAVAVDEGERRLEAAGIVKNFVIGSMGVGTLPLPLFDVAALVALQLRMIQRLSRLYDRTFSEKAVRSVVLSLLGGGFSVGLGIGASSLLKVIPGVGWAMGGLGMPALAGAATYAIGQVYIRHFEQGGTVVDLNADSVRGYYKEQFRKGKEEAAEAAAAEEAAPA